jgi:hypothetical protein
MSTRKRTRTTAPETKVEETTKEEISVEKAPEIEAHAEEQVEETESPVEEIKSEVEEEKPNNTLKPAQSPEVIQAQIRTKLSGHKEGDKEDLFNPNVSQAATKAKMEQVAQSQGFELTRGREIGARLLARSAQMRNRP